MTAKFSVGHHENIKILSVNKLACCIWYWCDGSKNVFQYRWLLVIRILLFVYFLVYQLFHMIESLTWFYIYKIEKYIKLTAIINNNNHEYIKHPWLLIHDNFKTLTIIYTLSKLDEHCSIFWVILPSIILMVGYYPQHISLHKILMVKAWNRKFRRVDLC